MTGVGAIVAALCVGTAGQAPPDQGDNPKVPPPHVQDLKVPERVSLPKSQEKMPDEPDRPLSADEAARIALRKQPSLGVSLANAFAARGRTNQVRSGLFPQVSAGLGYDELESLSGNGVSPTQAPFNFALPTVSPIDRYIGGVALKQLVYDFDQTRNLVRQSQALERVAESGLNAAQLQVVHSVKAAFYNYAYAEQLVKVNEQNVDNRQRQYDLAEERLTAGVGLPSDVVTALTSKSQGILALNIARDNAEQARISLLIEMGIDPMTPIVLDDSKPKVSTVGDPRQLVKIALKKRPEVRAAENNVLASKFGLSAARSVNSPSVYLGMAAGTRGQDFPLDDSTFSFQLGIAIPIYDGGLRAGAVQTSQGQLTAAQAQLQSTLLSVQNDVASAYLSYKSAEQRVTIAENEVLNAREGVRIAEGRYRSGLGQFQDITTAQALLLGALTDQTLARNAEDVAENQVRFSTGEALDGMVVDTASASRRR